MWACRGLLRVGDLHVLVSARLEEEHNKLRVGLPTMLAALPASWQAALQRAAPQAQLMVSADSSHQRMWRREACGRLQVTHLASANCALLPAPPALLACGQPHACLQPALVMPWSPARRWHPRQGPPAEWQQGEPGG